MSSCDFKLDLSFRIFPLILFFPLIHYYLLKSNFWSIVRLPKDSGTTFNSFSLNDSIERFCRYPIESGRMERPFLLNISSLIEVTGNHNWKWLFPPEIPLSFIFSPSDNWFHLISSVIKFCSCAME